MSSNAHNVKLRLSSRLRFIRITRFGATTAKLQWKSNLQAQGSFSKVMDGEGARSEHQGHINAPSSSEFDC